MIYFYFSLLFLDLLGFPFIFLVFLCFPSIFFVFLCFSVLFVLFFSRTLNFFGAQFHNIMHKNHFRPVSGSTPVRVFLVWGDARMQTQEPWLILSRGV